MASAADPVAEHAREGQLGIEACAAVHDGCERSSHAGHIHYQQHGDFEPFCQLCGRAFVRRGSNPVEEAHDTFDQRDICVRRGGVKGAQHGFSSHHPGVEGVALGLGRSCMVGRVEVIRARFEDGDGKAAPGESAAERDHAGGFSASA